MRRQFSRRLSNKLDKSAFIFLNTFFSNPFYISTSCDLFPSTFLTICTEASPDMQSLMGVRRDAFLINSSQIQESNQSCYFSLDPDVFMLQLEFDM